MSPKKVRAGVSFGPPFAEALDVHARSLSDLFVDRSEIVNAILDDYFEDNGTTESVWSTATERRVRKGSCPP